MKKKNAGAALLRVPGKRTKTVLCVPVHKKNRKPNDDSRRRSAFAAELYRQERGRHWQPRGLTKNDRLEVTRRESPEWRS